MAKSRLITAIENRDIEQVKKYLEEKDDPNEIYQYESALNYCVEVGSYIDERDEKNGNLSKEKQLAKEKRLAIANLLIEAKADVNGRQPMTAPDGRRRVMGGVSVLDHAFVVGDPAMIYLLLEKKADPKTEVGFSGGEAPSLNSGLFRFHPKLQKMMREADDERSKQAEEEVYERPKNKP